MDKFVRNDMTELFKSYIQMDGDDARKVMDFVAETWNGNYPRHLLVITGAACSGKTYLAQVVNRMCHPATIYIDPVDVECELCYAFQKNALNNPKVSLILVARSIKGLPKTEEHREIIHIERNYDGPDYGVVDWKVFENKLMRVWKVKPNLRTEEAACSG